MSLKTLEPWMMNFIKPFLLYPKEAHNDVRFVHYKEGWGQNHFQFNDGYLGDTPNPFDFFNQWHRQATKFKPLKWVSFITKNRKIYKCFYVYIRKCKTKTWLVYELEDRKKKGEVLLSNVLFIRDTFRGVEIKLIS